MALIITNKDVPRACEECFLAQLKDETDMGARITYIVDCEGQIVSRWGRRVNCPIKDVSEYLDSYKATDWRKAKPILDETIDGPGKDGNIKESKTEYKAKVKELELAIALCEQAEKEFKSRTCKFRSPINCDFCAFHSECEEHWKEGDEK